MNKIRPFLWLILLLHLVRGSEENYPDNELEAEVQEVELPAEVYDLLQKAAWGEDNKRDKERRDERDLSNDYEVDEGSEDEDNGSKGLEDKPGLFSWFSSKSAPGSAAVQQLSGAKNASTLKQQELTVVNNVMPGGQQIGYNENEARVALASTPSDVDEKVFLPSAFAPTRAESNPSQLAGGMDQLMAKNEGNKNENPPRNQVQEDSFSERSWKPNLIQDESMRETNSIVNNPSVVKEQGKPAQFQRFYQNPQNQPPLRPFNSQIQPNGHQIQSHPQQQSPAASTQLKQFQKPPPPSQPSSGMMLMPNVQDQSVPVLEPMILPAYQTGLNQQVQDNSQMQIGIEQQFEPATPMGETDNVQLIVVPSRVQKQFQKMPAMNDLNKFENFESENQKLANEHAAGQQVRESSLLSNNEGTDGQISRQPYEFQNEQQSQLGPGVAEANEINSNVQRVNPKRKEHLAQPYPLQTLVKLVNQQVQSRVSAQNVNSRIASRANIKRNDQVVFDSNSLNFNGPLENKKARMVRDKILKSNVKQNVSKVTKASGSHSATTAKNALSFQHPIPAYPNDMFAKNQPTTTVKVVSPVDEPLENAIRAASKIRRGRDLKTFKQSGDSTSGSTARPPLDGKARLFFQKLQSDLLELQNSVLSQPKMSAPNSIPDNDNMKVHVKVSFEMVPKDEQRETGGSEKRNTKDDDAS